MTENTMHEVERQIAIRQEDAMLRQPESLPGQMALFENFGDRMLRESHGFTGSPRDVWGQIALAGADDVLDLADYFDTPLEVVNYYAHEADLAPDANGEVKRIIRSVLFAADGKRYATASEGIGRDLMRLICMFGRAPWTPPAKVKAVAIKTGRGFRTFKLLPA